MVYAPAQPPTRRLLPAKDLAPVTGRLEVRGSGRRAVGVRSCHLAHRVAGQTERASGNQQIGRGRRRCAVTGVVVAVEGEESLAKDAHVANSGSHATPRGTECAPEVRVPVATGGTALGCGLILECAAAVRPGVPTHHSGAAHTIAMHSTPPGRIIAENYSQQIGIDTAPLR